MSKMSRDKGARYERKISGYIAEKLGIMARRHRGGFSGDDIEHSLQAFVSYECKDQAATSLGSWLDQCVSNAGDRIAVVIHHRRGNGDPAKDFATLPLSDLCRLLDRAYLTDGDDHVRGIS